MGGESDGAAAGRACDDLAQGTRDGVGGGGDLGVEGKGDGQKREDRVWAIHGWYY